MAEFLRKSSASMIGPIVNLMIVRFEARFSLSNSRRTNVGSRPEYWASWYSLYPHSLEG